MDSSHSSQASGSVVERNVIDFLAHRKSATSGVNQGSYLSGSVHSSNIPRVQPRPQRRPFVCTHCALPFSSYVELETHASDCHRSPEKSRSPIIVVRKPLSGHLNLNDQQKRGPDSLQADQTKIQISASDRVSLGNWKDDANSKCVPSTSAGIQGGQEKSLPPHTSIESDSRNIVTVVDSPIEVIARGGKLYKCSLCAVSDDATANLYKHMKISHPYFTIVNKRAMIKKMKEQQKESQSQTVESAETVEFNNRSRQLAEEKSPEGYKEGRQRSEKDIDVTPSQQPKSRVDGKSLWDYSFLNAGNTNNSAGEKNMSSRGRQTVTDNVGNILKGSQIANSGRESSVMESSHIRESNSNATDRNPMDGLCLDSLDDDDDEVMVARNSKRTKQILKLENDEVTREIGKSRKSGDDAENDTLAGNSSVQINEKHRNENDSVRKGHDGTDLTVCEVDLNKECDVTKDQKNFSDNPREHVSDNTYQGLHADTSVKHNLNANQECGQDSERKEDCEEGLDGSDGCDQSDDDLTSHNLSQKEAVTGSKVSLLSFLKPSGTPAPWDKSSQRSKKINVDVSCTQTVPSESSKYVHVVDFEGKGIHRYKCSVCRLTSHNTSNLYRHMKSAHKDLAIVNKKSKTNVSVSDDRETILARDDGDSELFDNMENDDNNDDVGIKFNPNSVDGQQFECSGCDFKAISLANLSSHIQNVHADVLGISTRVNKPVDGDRSGKEKTVHVIDSPMVGSHRYQCSACLRTSNSTGGLYDHMRRVHKGFKILFRRPNSEEEAKYNYDVGNERQGNWELEMNSSGDEEGTVHILDIPAVGGCLFRCSKCGSTCNNLSNMYKHVRRMHKGMTIGQRIRRKRRDVHKANTYDGTEACEISGDVTNYTANENSDDENGDSVHYGSDVNEPSGENIKQHKGIKTISTVEKLKLKLKQRIKGVHKTGKSYSTLNKRSYGKGAKSKSGKSVKSNPDSEVATSHVNSDGRNSDIVRVISIPPNVGRHQFKCSECHETFRFLSSVHRHMRAVHKNMTLVIERRQESIENIPSSPEGCGDSDESDSNVGNTDPVDSSTPHRATDLDEAEIDGDTFDEESDSDSKRHDKKERVVLGKRGRQSKSNSRSSGTHEEDEHNSDAFDEDAAGPTKSKKKCERSRDHSAPKSKSIGNADSGATKRPTSTNKITFSNERMEKILRGGLTILNMARVDSEVSVSNEKDNDEDNGSLMTYDDDADRHNKYDSEEDITGDSDDSSITERSTKNKSVKHRGNRYGKHLKRNVKQKQSDKEVPADPKKVVAYTSVLNELNVVGDHEDGKNVVRPIVITDPGCKPRYKCSECGLVCNVASNLYKHMRNIHHGMTVIQRRPTRRTILDDWDPQSHYNTGQVINDDQDTVHIVHIPPTKEGYRFKCSRCDVVCRDSSNMHKHMRRNHQGMRIVSNRRSKNLVISPSSRDSSAIHPSKNVSALNQDHQNVYEMGQDQSIQSRSEDESCVKTPTKSFWDYFTCSSLSDNSPPEDQLVNKTQDIVQEGGVTMLKMPTPGDRSLSVDHEQQPADDSEDVSPIISSEVESESRVFVEEEVRNDNNVISINSFTPAAQPSEPALLSGVGVGGSGRNGDRELLDISHTNTNTYTHTNTNRNDMDSATVADNKTVRVIDIPIGKGRLRYKCSECSLVCNNIGNLYKHIRKMHPLLVLIPRPRKNKAWYAGSLVPL